MTAVMRVTPELDPFIADAPWPTGTEIVRSHRVDPLYVIYHVSHPEIAATNVLPRFTRLPDGTVVFEAWGEW